jgi:hypothetical protein
MSPRSTLVAALFPVLVIALGCSDSSEPPPADCSSVVDTTVVPTVSYSGDIVPMFAQDRYGCLEGGCHGGILLSSNYDLRSHAAVLQPGDQARDLRVCAVRPGAPDESYLLWKMEGRRDIRGMPMPNGCRNSSDPFACVSAEDLELVRRWILEGALDN